MLTSLVRRHPRWVLGVAIVVGLAPFWLSPAVAQPVVVERQPDFGEPQQYWYCTNCHGVVGFGPIPPAVDKCPQCGVRIGFGFGNSEPTSPKPAIPAASPEIQLSPPVLAGIGVTTLILVVGGLAFLFNRDKGPEPIKDPSKLHL